MELLGPTIDWAAVRAEFNALASQELKADAEATAISGPTFEDIINDIASPELSLEKISLYNKRLGLTARTGPTGHALINGKHLPLTVDEVIAFCTLVISCSTG